MRAKKKKNKMTSVYIFPVLFLVICLSYLIRFIFFNIETDIVKYDSTEDVIHTKSLIIRSESVTALPSGVDINYKVGEGERVSNGKRILEIVKSKKADENIAIKIEQLDDRIKEIEKSDVGNGFFSQDEEKIESNINESLTELKNISKSGNFEKLNTVKNDLAANLYKKSLIYGSGSFFGKNLDQLRKEKATLEGIYNDSIDVIYAQASGVVSYSVDGYEQILSPLNIKNFKLNNIKEIMNSLNSKRQGKEKDTPAGIKLVDNYEWYTCSLISVSQTEGLKVGKKIKLRFGEFGNAEVNGEIYEVSQPDGDMCMVITKINEYVNDFYKKRIAEMDIIKDYNEGFTVPAKAIVVKNDTKGVYALKKGIIKFIPVAVLTEVGDRYLVRNLDKKDSNFNQAYDSLKIFDEVITTTNRVKENQVLIEKI